MSQLTAAINHFDLAVTRYIQAWPTWLHPIMTAASFVGHPATVTVIAVGMLVYAVWQRRYNLVGLMLTSTAALLVSPILKQIWQRTRPDTAATMGLHTYSFPSGHTYSATLIFGLLAVLAGRYLPHGWAVAAIIALVALIILVGISRVYLGAHYPTDVLGGWVLGAIFLLIIVKAVKI